MHLNPANQKSAAEFLHSPLWLDLKRCLLARRPDKPDAKDDVHVTAQKGMKRVGFEDAIEAFEKIPFDFVEEKPNPFARPALFTED